MSKGLSNTNTILLKGSTVATKTIAEVTYDWEYVLPKGTRDHIEEDIENVLAENFIDVRLVINLRMLLQNYEAGGMGTEFLLTDFLPSGSKQYKEQSWADYIDVVMAKKSGGFPLYKKFAGFTEVKIQLKSSKPYSKLSDEVAEAFHDMDYHDSTYHE